LVARVLKKSTDCVEISYYMVVFRIDSSFCVVSFSYRLGLFSHLVPETRNISKQGGKKEMSEEKFLNGVDVGVVEGVINAVKEEPDLAESEFRVKNEWIDAGHNRTTVTGFYSAGQEISHTEPFVLDADEPPILAGQDRGANPVEHLLHSLAS